MFCSTTSSSIRTIWNKWPLNVPSNTNDSMIIWQCYSWQKAIRLGTQNKFSVTRYIFLKSCFLQPQFTGNKKKIQKSVSLQNKARTNLLSAPISITEGIRSLKAAPVISLVSSSLPPMQIFNYIILDTVLPRSQSSPQQVLPKLILKYTLWGKAGKGISSTWRGMHQVLHACMFIVVKSWSSGHKQVNWETQ